MYIVVNSNEELNKLNTQKFKGPWFVWYYADWCGHCQMMKDEWEKLVESNPNVNLAKVSDSYVQPNDNIAGYPTLKLYNSNPKSAAGRKSNIVDYQGSRDVESFTEFLKKNVKKQSSRKQKKPKKRSLKRRLSSSTPKSKSKSKSKSRQRSRRM